MAKQIEVSTTCEDCTTEFKVIEFEGVPPQPKCCHCLRSFEESLINATEYS